MGKRGPAPGHGGRPRSKHPAANDAGYKLTTTGPAGHGKRELLHRVIADGGTVGGLKTPPASSNRTKTVVNHLDRNRADDRPSNLRKTSRSVNNTAKYRTPGGYKAKRKPAG